MSDQNPFLGREVKSRRGGKVKEPLSRDRIVEAALHLLTREGLDGMSVRAVASALDTGPASLYAYVVSLNSLRALVLDRALGDVDTTFHRRRSWRSRVKGVLASYARVLLGTPGLAQLALSTIAAGPSSLRIIEALLEALDDGGLDARTSAWAVDLLLLYVTAIGAEQTQRDPATPPTGPIALALQAASVDEFPRVHAARAELLSGEGTERFEWALDTLIAGVLSNPRRAKRGAPRK
jgi:AcrR family transcriptional regulator